jgi:hypothetical protein
MRGAWLVGSLLLLACGAHAAAGEYTDPSGFSLKFPDGWVAVNSGLMEHSSDTIPEAVKAMVANGQVDLNSIAVMVIRDSKDDTFENLNVVVEKEQIPVDDNSLKELKTVVAQQYSKMGVTITNFQAKIQKVANRDAIVMDFDSQQAGVKQKQVMLPGGGKTYIVTFTGDPATFKNYEPTFDTILANFQAPAPVAAKGFNWNKTLTMGIVGGVIGGLVGLINWFKNKSGAKPQA